MFFLIIYDFLECATSDECNHFKLMQFLSYKSINTCYKPISKNVKKKKTVVKFLSKKKNRHYIQCVFCDMNYSFPNKYYLHMRYHSRIKKFSCYKCNKNFRTRNALNIHKLVHKDKIKYKCKPCSKIFKTYYKVKNHLNEFHSIKMKYVCKLCNEEFKTEQDIFTHKDNCSHNPIDEIVEEVNGSDWNQQYFWENEQNIDGFMTNNELSGCTFIGEK